MQPICSFHSVPRWRVWFLAASDAAGVGAAMLASVFLRLGWSDGREYLMSHQTILIASWVMFLLALGIAGLYEPNQLQRPGRMVAAASAAVLICMLLMTSLAYATSAAHIGRGIFLLFAILALFAVLAIRWIDRLMRGLGLTTSRCLIVGANGAAGRAIDLIRRHPNTGLQLVGLVDSKKDDLAVGTLVGNCPVLGTDVALEELVRSQRIEKLVLAEPANVETGLLRRLRSFRYRGLALDDYQSLHEELTQEVSLEDINEQWLLAASMNNSRFHIRRLKRALDVAGSLVGLMVAAPIMAVVAVLIKLDSRGPVFYRQERVGREGVPFIILKFRTMAIDAEAQTGPVWATEHDPRITRAGRWLRKFRIDEIPQLINVLRGDMSLVGPRPERPVFVKQLSELIPFYTERLMVRPGITGWAQVMRSYAASIEDSRGKLQSDLYYIKHMSFVTDMYVILKTVKVVLFGRERDRSEKVPVTSDRSRRAKAIWEWQTIGRLFKNKAFVAGWSVLRPVYHALASNVIYRSGMTKNMGGHTLRVGFEQRHVRSSDTPDHEIEAILDVLQPGMTVLDIGANRGYLSVLFGQKVGPGGKVYAFEPSPKAFEMLQQNTRLNRLTNVIEPHNLALARESGHLDFYLNENEVDWNHTAVPIPGSTWHKTVVQAVSVDSFCQQHRVLPDVIKIDVEGFEMAVLEGARDVLHRLKNLAIFVELHPVVWPTIGQDQSTFFQLLGELGLTPLTLDGKPFTEVTDRCHIRLVSMQPISAFRTHQPSQVSNDHRQGFNGKHDVHEAVVLNH